MVGRCCRATLMLKVCAILATVQIAWSFAPSIVIRSKSLSHCGFLQLSNDSPLGRQRRAELSSLRMVGGFGTKTPHPNDVIAHRIWL